MALHPSTEEVLKYFDYDHLPTGRLQQVSVEFKILADKLVQNEGWNLSGPELTMALRKLLEAKDWAVRAALPL